MANIEPSKGEIVMYQPDETIRLEVRMDGETVWLSANQMANLFDRDEKTIRKHINNVFSEEEVPKNINTHFLRVDGVKQPVAFYTLDVIISVGYRVKSKRGTSFRIWANQVLKDYLLKGYSVNKSLQEVKTQLGTQDKRISLLEDKVDFFVRSSLPPVEGIFSDHQPYQAGQTLHRAHRQLHQRRHPDDAQQSRCQRLSNDLHPPTLPAAATRPATSQPAISAYRRQRLPTQPRPLPDHRR